MGVAGAVKSRREAKATAALLCSLLSLSVAHCRSVSLRAPHQARPALSPLRPLSLLGPRCCCSIASPAVPSVFSWVPCGPLCNVTVGTDLCSLCPRVPPRHLLPRGQARTRRPQSGSLPEMQGSLRPVPVTQADLFCCGGGEGTGLTEMLSHPQPRESSDASAPERGTRGSPRLQGHKSLAGAVVNVQREPGPHSWGAWGF